MSKKEKKMGFFRILKALAPKLFKAAGGLWIAVILADAFYSLFAVLIIKFQERFFEDITNVITKNEGIKLAITSLIFLGTVKLIEQILNAVSNYMPDIFYRKALGKISYELHEKINNLSPINFEDTKKLDSINKARQGAESAITFVLRFGYIVTYYLVYIIAMTFYLFNLDKRLAFAILFVFVPTIFSQLIRMKVFQKVEDKSAPIRREYEYYEECMIQREYYKETRLLGAFSYFKKLYIEALEKLQHIKCKAEFKTGMLDLGLSVVTILGYSGVLYLLFSSMLEGNISVGAFAAVYASIGQLYNMVESMMRYSVGGIARDFGQIVNYINFLELKEDEGIDYEAEENVSIEVNNISFAYPSEKDEIADVANRKFKWDHYGELIDSDLLKDIEGEEQKVLKDVVKSASFKINAGETVAIVGENGSGKSTIIRLLTGIYSPREGSIHFNGKDISVYKKNHIFKNISAVFQKYQRYQMTLSDNIGISDVNKEVKTSELDEIAKLAGLNIDELTYPKGYDTMLSREFDGVDLSGGQWQRVAIARAFFRKHAFIVLDEPTSAIDPYEETRIYNQFAKIAKDKTAIIVTHRLGSVKLADRIIVMKDGEVVEVGKHEELISKKGEYNRLYTSQQQWYVEA